MATYEESANAFALPSDVRVPDDLAGSVNRFLALANTDPNMAWSVFGDELDVATAQRIDAVRLRPVLLATLLPPDADRISLASDDASKDATQALALAWNLVGGFPGRALPLYAAHEAMCVATGDDVRLAAGMGNHAKALRQAGFFQDSDAAARRGLAVQRRIGARKQEAVNLYWLGMGLAHRGIEDESEAALRASLDIFTSEFEQQSRGATHAFLAQRSLWLGDASTALEHANAAWELGAALEEATPTENPDRYGARKVTAASARMQGEALGLLGRFDAARVRLREALELADEVEFTEETLPALRAAAMVEFEAGDLDAAEASLARTWELATRGPFPLYDADSHLILARIHLARGKRGEALAAALAARELSWCQGPPFSYARGLVGADHMLAEIRTAQENADT